MAYLRSISLTEESWLRLQQYLTDHPDTNFNAVTRQAIERFLTTEGYPCASDVTSLTTE